MKRWSFLLILLLLVMSAAAQEENFVASPESGRAFALSITVEGLQVGSLQQTFGGTIDIDYNPADSRRWARVDNHGILRFVHLGNPNIAEGVYTFAPFFEGFAPPEPFANKIFVRDVEWSPDGRNLAFRIENEALPDMGQGVWFWQPLMESSSDPSYQLLRPCPGYCDQAGVPASYPGWQAYSIEWSSDSSSLLIGLNVLEYGGRRALLVRSAQRTNPPPATQLPNFLLYDYGHWGVDGQVIVVSGRGPEDTVVFGTVDRSGGNAILTLASDLNLAWVQDAVQQADGSFLMLGSPISQMSPLHLVNQDGVLLTPPIGNSFPTEVKWSPDRSAVMLRMEDEVYVAQTNGTVHEIGDLLRDDAGNISPNVDWVNGAMPTGFMLLNLSEPIAEGTYVPEVTPEATVSADNPAFVVGDLLRVNSGTLDIFAEPVTSATVLGTLQTGDELIITDGPVAIGGFVWYRVQTLDYTGWINNSAELVYPEN